MAANCPGCVELREDNARLLRGEFTPEEFQNLCHNLNVEGLTRQEAICAFKRGCEEYQAKLFGIVTV